VEDVLRAWLISAGHDPLAQAVLIVSGTFVLEDVTTVLTAMGVQTGAVDPVLALCALYVGVVLGDLGLYGLGRAAARLRLARRWAPSVYLGREWLRTNLAKAVFVSRFLPGARLPTFTACGFFGAGFARFALVAILATVIWTSLLFVASLRVGQALIDHLGQWRWIGMAGFALTLVLIGRIVSRLRTGTS
jgi:membrane protein DedA with SNARE-associated domain